MTSVAQLSIDFTANTSSALAGIDQVDSALQGLSGKIGGGLQNLGSSMTSLGASFAPLALAISGVGYAGIDAASQFDSSMAEISARTGLVGQDLENVRNFALQMGADTAFSAQQASDAMLQLLSSGQTAEQAMATLPIVMDMAAASGEALGLSADVLTDIMAAYGLSIEAVSPSMQTLADQLGVSEQMLTDWGNNVVETTPELENMARITGLTTQEIYDMFMATEDAASVADSLARAAGASSADIGSLGQGFANVAPLAASFGLSVDETAAALAILSENGIKGAEAGTAFKTVLKELGTGDSVALLNELGVSFYDAQGNARDFSTIIGELDTVLDGMTMEEQNQIMQDLVGSYGAVALEAFRGETSIEDMTAAMAAQPSAAQVAAARMNTFAGRIDALKGSVETLMIRAFTPFMNDVLKPLAEDLTVVINSVADLASENPVLATRVIMVGAAFVGLTTALITLGPIIGAIGAGITALGVGVGFILSPIGLLIAGIAAIGVAYATNFLGFQDAVDGLVSSITTFASTIKSAFDTGGITGVLDVFRDSFSNLGQVVTDAIPGLLANLASFGSQIWGWIESNAPVVAAKMLSWAANFANWVTTDAIPKLFTALGTLGTIVGNWITLNAPILANNLVQWATKFSGWVADALPGMLAKLDELNASMLQFVVDKAAVLGFQLMAWGVELSLWVINAVPGLLLQFANFFTNIDTWIITNAPILAEKMIAFTNSIVDWAEKAIPPLVANLTSIWNTLSFWLLNKYALFSTEINKFKDKITSWVADAIPTLVTHLGSFWDTLKASADGMATAILTEAKEIGSGLLSGIKQGVEDNWNSFDSWIRGQISGIVGSALSILGIHSPSTVFADEVGKWIPAGIAVGIEGGMPAALGAMENMSMEMVATAMPMAVDAPYSPPASTYSAPSSGGNMTIEVLQVYANDVQTLFDQLEQVRAQRAN